MREQLELVERVSGAYVSTMLDLSTAHMPESVPRFNDVRHVEHEHGYVVFTTQPTDETPDWIRPILEAAKRAGALLINFDADALRQSDVFKTWEW